MKNFWKLVNEVINKADVILLVLDARLIEETRNSEIERKVKKLKKPLIYVISKSDLLDRGEIEKKIKHLRPNEIISAKEHLGTNMLRKRIMAEATKAKLNLEKIKVGVLGYPNVGKSSLINALKGKKSAGTSIISGYTKGIQRIKVTGKIQMIDTPGVIPYKEKDDIKHAFIGTIDFNNAKEPDLVVMKLMQEFPGVIEKHFGVEEQEDKEEIIIEIAIKNKIFMKGKKPDILRMSRMILKDWQKGVIK